MGCAAQPHTKNPCLINPPRQRRPGGEGGREGGKRKWLQWASMWDNKRVFTSKNTRELKTSTNSTTWNSHLMWKCRLWLLNSLGQGGEVTREFSHMANKGAHHLVITHSWPCNAIYRYQTKSRKCLNAQRAPDGERALISAFLRNAENSIIRQSATMSAELVLDQRRPCDRM